MMKPLPSARITASSGRPWPSTVVASRANCSGAIHAGLPALIATRYATDGRKPSTIAGACFGGVAWKACTVMSIATYTDRQSVVEGKSVSVSLDLGVRRTLKKHKNDKNK